MGERHFEDVSVGERQTVGTATLSASDVATFAERYDPRPSRRDADPEQSAGGAVASCWQATAVVNRLVIEGYFGDVAVLGGRGVDRLRWPTPVEPGDQITARVAVLCKEPGTRPDRGLLRVRTSATNRRDETVYTGVMRTMVARRTPAETAEG